MSDVVYEPKSNELKAAVDDVLRKIGRNVLLFQQLEALFKSVLVKSNVSGLASNMDQKVKKRSDSLRKKSMGQLVGQLHEELFGPESENGSPDLDDMFEIGVSTTFRIELTTEQREESKIIYKKLVADRNELIHHLLPSIDINSIESCITLAAKLDAQSKIVLHEIKHMQSIAHSVDKGLKVVASARMQPEIMEWMSGRDEPSTDSSSLKP